MTGFAHRMPFGASLERDGLTRFRLWAPAMSQLRLSLPDRNATIPMEPSGDGWFTLRAQANPGARYAFVLDDGSHAPDPASRAQERDPDGPSLIVDPEAYAWRSAEWHGRPWAEAVLYELHVGTFSPEGNFDGVRKRLAALKTSGITALSLMPVADFPGSRNWGYDGVLPFAPDARYGRPEALKALIDTAHQQDLMILLDVVYNHFGPSGNHLGRYAPAFFTGRHHTPWGAAIDFSQRTVRDYFIHNALYWLEEYRFDGLRFDAVHAIADDSEPDILTELARTVRREIQDRQIHLVLENDRNCASLLARDPEGHPLAYTAQWNDDFHHAAHALLTGESAGYYGDYAGRPIAMLARCLAEGFAYQGEPSPFRGGAARGEPTAGLPPDAFVGFLQNHDQIGNRAFGERLTALAKPDALRALRVIQLLAPAIPLLFMGEEWGSAQPFQFFCDFTGPLAESIRRGRREDAAHFPQIAGDSARPALPDPTAVSTFLNSKLVWPGEETAHAALTAALLALRAKHIVPLLSSRFLGAEPQLADGLLSVSWRFAAGMLRLCANLSEHPLIAQIPPDGEIIFATPRDVQTLLPPWFVAWSVSPR